MVEATEVDLLQKTDLQIEKCSKYFFNITPLFAKRYIFEASMSTAMGRTIVDVYSLSLPQWFPRG